MPKMSKSEVISLFQDVGRLHELVSRVYPSAHLTPELLQHILEDARRSNNPKLGFLHTEGKAKRVEENPENSAGKHTLYALSATHTRSAPYSAGFTEACQAVRVTLPQLHSQAKAIDTHLGVVKPSDHLIFSAAEVAGRFEQAFGSTPPVERVDLITGARYLDLVRFSPVSIFLAFEKESDSIPTFYFLESGSATGTPEALYYADSMSSTIHATADFAFTPFACPANWYTGSLRMDSTQKEPREVAISVAQNKNGQRHYLDLSVTYQTSLDGAVICPGEQFIVAVMRVFALGLGMNLEDSSLARDFGEFCRDVLSWNETPPLSGQAEGFRGCLGSDS